MIGVSSRLDAVGAMLPESTRVEFQHIYPQARPGAARRLAARLVGRVVMKRTIGTPRKAVPVPS